MTRTTRRSRIEITGPKYGNKQARRKPGTKAGGHYTYWEYIFVGGGHNHGMLPIYRPCTPVERDQEFHWLHGESKNHNAWGPGPYYRQLYAQAFKTREKKELVKALKFLDDYDAIFYEKPVDFGRMWAWY